jgi:L-rhamnose mutarotase
MAEIAETEICQRWWASMSELMLTQPDDSPQTVALREVFHLD